MRLLKLVLVLCAPGALFYACKDSGNPAGPGGENLPVLTSEPRDTAVTAGQSVRFTVAATGAASYQWVRLPADTLPGATSATLVVLADTALDSASYVCLVRNAKGVVQTRAALLRVARDSVVTPPVPPGPRNCAANPVTFTHYLIDPNLVKVVAQIGSIGGANTELVGRSYIFPKDGQAGQRLPLIAPTALRLRGSKHYRPDGAPTTGYVPDWSLMFDAECGISLEFYHVKDVSDSIKAVSDTVVYPSSNWELVSRRPSFKAGDTIGWYIPAAPGGLAAFDFIARNDSIVNRFANQARYVAYNSNLLNIVCPYDLFEAPKKAAYYARLGSVGGVAYPEAGCGTVARDSLGTPAGQWWFDSAFTPGSRPLRKEGLYGDPMQIITGPDSTVMIGHTGPSNDIRFQRSNATWKKPETITTEWCYQVYTTPTTPDGWLWLKMIRADKMNVAYASTGTCPSTFPASGFKSYFR